MFSQETMIGVSVLIKDVLNVIWSGLWECFTTGRSRYAPILAVSALRCGGKRLLLASGKRFPTITFHRIACKFTNNK